MHPDGLTFLPGMDLPLKTLVWQDDQGKTWLGYNDPEWLARRHAISTEAHSVLMAMTGLLATIAGIATASNP